MTTEKPRIRVAIGIAASVWFVLALFSDGQVVSTTALRTVSIAGTAATIVFVLYDRFVWKWRIVRTFTNRPLIAGTWRGQLQSDFVPPGGKKSTPIPTAIRVKQTNTSIFVTLFTMESQSITEQGRLFREDDDRWRLSWTYVNDPRVAVQDKIHKHRGVCDIYISGRDGEVLQGSYFTSRKTAGEITLTEWSEHNYGDVVSALNGTDFGPSKPFAGLFS